MFKKYFFLFLVLFSHGMVLSQEGVEEVKKGEWSTKKKVLVGVAIIAVATASGVIIYYGPAACIASIKATAVAAKFKVVTLSAKAMGATNAFTYEKGGETVAMAIFGKGATVNIVLIGGREGVSATSFLARPLIAAATGVKGAILTAYTAPSPASISIALGTIARLGTPSKFGPVFETSAGKVMVEDLFVAGVSAACLLGATVKGTVDTFNYLSDKDNCKAVPSICSVEEQRLKILEIAQMQSLAERLKAPAR